MLPDDCSVLFGFRVCVFEITSMIVLSVIIGLRLWLKLPFITGYWALGEVLFLSFHRRAEPLSALLKRSWDIVIKVISRS